MGHALTLTRDGSCVRVVQVIYWRCSMKCESKFFLKKKRQ
jgi:hypothetical protein